MTDFINILYPINLDSKSHNTIKKALEIAEKNGSRIHFLYVNDESAGYRHPADFEDAVALKVKENAPADLIEKVNPIYSVSKGDLASKIKDYCTENQIDLIIISHKHHGKLHAALFDTPDENIIDTVNIPIMLFPKNQ